MFNGGIGNWHYGWRRRDACRRGHGGENGETRGQERGPEGELIDLQFIGQVFRGIIGVWTAFGGPQKKTIAFDHDLLSVIPAAQSSGASAVFPPWVPPSLVLPFLACLFSAVSSGFSLLLHLSSSSSAWNPLRGCFLATS